MNCLVCENCFEAEPEESLLMCDKCEKGFHMGCLTPVFFFN